jgi:hypothetical protein
MPVENGLVFPEFFGVSRLCGILRHRFEFAALEFGQRLD